MCLASLPLLFGKEYKLNTERADKESLKSGWPGFDKLNPFLSFKIRFVNDFVFFLFSFYLGIIDRQPIRVDATLFLKTALKCIRNIL